MDRTVEYIQRCGDKISIFEGVDSLFLQALVMGVDGAVSGPTLNVAPEILIGIYDSFIRGDIKNAVQLQKKVLTLWKATCRPATLGTYPATVKEAMNMVGVPVGPPKAPLLPLQEAKKTELRIMLKHLSLAAK